MWNTSSSQPNSNSEFSTETRGVSSSKKKPKESIKRGKRKSRKRLEKVNRTQNNNDKLTILCANAAGIFNKLDSLVRNIQHFKPAVIQIQETIYEKDVLWN